MVPNTNWILGGGEATGGDIQIMNTNNTDADGVPMESDAFKWMWPILCVCVCHRFIQTAIAIASIYDVLSTSCLDAVRRAIEFKASCVFIYVHVDLKSMR